MSNVTMKPSTPKEREIEVTVTLTFPESQLRKWDRDCVLAEEIAAAFKTELYEGEAGGSLYVKLGRLA